MRQMCPVGFRGVGNLKKRALLAFELHHEGREGWEDREKGRRGQEGSGTLFNSCSSSVGVIKFGI